MLKEDTFINLRINYMNWAILDASPDKEYYHEITMQLFFENGRPLSNMTMIPLSRNGASQPKSL